jgi:translation elongation factor EF-Tu-like GTPase
LLEAEVRSHIRLQQQLKLHIDSTESRIEELEAEAVVLKTDNT